MKGRCTSVPVIESCRDLSEVGEAELNQLRTAHATRLAPRVGQRIRAMRTKLPTPIPNPVTVDPWMIEPSPRHDNKEA